MFSFVARLPCDVTLSLRWILQHSSICEREIPRASAKTFLLKDCTSLFVVFLQIFPVSLGQSFSWETRWGLYYPRWSNKQWCKMTVKGSVWFNLPSYSETPGKSNKRLAQTWMMAVCGTAGHSSSSAQCELLGLCFVTTFFLMCQKPLHEHYGARCYGLMCCVCVCGGPKSPGQCHGDE